MKKKTHTFTLEVRTYGTRKRAMQAVLASFATRMPDGCEFYLQTERKKKAD